MIKSCGVIMMKPARLRLRARLRAGVRVRVGGRVGVRGYLWRHHDEAGAVDERDERLDAPRVPSSVVPGVEGVARVAEHEQQ